MAWNQASLFLVAPGWRPVVQTAPNGRTATGQPLRILRMEREGTVPQHVLRVETVHTWLKGHGFSLDEVPPRYARWTWEDVEAFVGAEESEVRELYLSFTLLRESPSRWSTWKSLVVDLCETWNLNLIDVDQETKVGPEEMFRLLSRSMAWQQFESHFGWPSAMGTIADSAVR